MTMTHQVYEVFDGKNLMAQIYDLNSEAGVLFPTPATAELQCGFGQVLEHVDIAPHIHNKVERRIFNTSEFILVILGSMEVEFISSSGMILEKRVLTALEGFLQFSGGHKITISKGTRYIELKQGPYLGKEKDKTVL